MFCSYCGKKVLKNQRCRHCRKPVVLEGISEMESNRALERVLENVMEKTTPVDDSSWKPFGIAAGITLAAGALVALVWILVL